MYNDAELALRDFVDSFENHPYEKYCMDYAIYKNDLSKILKSSQEICSTLSTCHRNMADVIKRIDSLSNRKLIGTKSYDKIGAFKESTSTAKSYQVTTPLPDLAILGNAGNYIIKK